MATETDAQLRAPERWVILLHGIRTRGAWQKELTPRLNSAGIDVMPLDYGRFGALRLLWPPERERCVRWFCDKYRQEFSGNSTIPSAIAHSFGAYILLKAILGDSTLRFDRIILTGSIVSSLYPWDGVIERGQVSKVLNELGRRDIWPGIAGAVIKDAGRSGSAGFVPAHRDVLQVSNVHAGHSSLFNETNYKTRWIPFLLGGSDIPHTVDVPKIPVSFAYALTITLLILLTVTFGTLSWAYRSELYRTFHHITAHRMGASFMTDNDDFRRHSERHHLHVAKTDERTLINWFPQVFRLFIGSGERYEISRPALHNGTSARFYFDASDVFSFGLTYKQTAPAFVRVTFADGTRASGRGIESTDSGRPAKDFWGFVSERPIREVEISTVGNGTLYIDEMEFGASAEYVGIPQPFVSFNQCILPASNAPLTFSGKIHSGDITAPSVTPWLEGPNGSPRSADAPISWQGGTADFSFTMTTHAGRASLDGYYVVIKESTNDPADITWRALQDCLGPR
jgi:hypothetical protein